MSLALWALQSYQVLLRRGSTKGIIKKRRVSLDEYHFYHHHRKRLSITCYVPGTMHSLSHLISTRTSFYRGGNWGLEKSLSITQWTGDWSRILSRAQSLSYLLPLRKSLLQETQKVTHSASLPSQVGKEKSHRGNKDLPQPCCVSVSEPRPRFFSVLSMCPLPLAAEKNQRDGGAMGEGVTGSGKEVENKQWS